MLRNPRINRRMVLAGAIGLPLLIPAITGTHAAPLPLVRVAKDPSCGCCDDWVSHIEAAGFPVRVAESGDMGGLKRRLGVPVELASCHTAQVDGYVIEGHVPAAALHRLLAERPEARGLAVPGMPAGSPGMEFPDLLPETYDVFLFGPTIGRFMRFRGSREI